MIRFDKRKIGPEYRIESAVIDSLPRLFFGKSEFWVAGAPRVGSGRPDLVIILGKPSNEIDKRAIKILCYLHRIPRASSKTISERVLLSLPIVEHALDNLCKKQIVLKDNNSYSLLPDRAEIISIEAKFSNWRSAFQQAARNQIFSHRSFVALPESVAIRVKSHPLLKQLGIGLLAVNAEDHVRVVKRSRKCLPKVWQYFYELAYHNSKTKGG